MGFNTVATLAIIGEIISFALWIAIRYGMYKSKFFMFNQNEIHHYDALLGLMVNPVWGLVYFLTGSTIALVMESLFIALPILIACDDIVQHWDHALNDDPSIQSPLKKITKKLWGWFYK